MTVQHLLDYIVNNEIPMDAEIIIANTKTRHIIYNDVLQVTYNNGLLIWESRYERPRESN